MIDHKHNILFSIITQGKGQYLLLLTVFMPHIRIISVVVRFQTVENYARLYCCYKRRSRLDGVLVCMRTKKPSLTTREYYNFDGLESDDCNVRVNNVKRRNSLNFHEPRYSST